MASAYKVYNREGKLVLSTDERCRYTAETERMMMENGYTIKLDGKKLTKKDIKNRGK